MPIGRRIVSVSQGENQRDALRRLFEEARVVCALGAGELTEAAAIRRLRIAGRFALRRVLLASGWLPSWPARPRSMHPPYP